MSCGEIGNEGRNLNLSCVHCHTFIASKKAAQEAHRNRRETIDITEKIEKDEAVAMKEVFRLENEDLKKKILSV